MSKELLRAYWIIQTQDIESISRAHVVMDLAHDGTPDSLFIFSTESRARWFFEYQLSRSIGKALVLYGLNSIIDKFANTIPTYILDCEDIDTIKEDDRQAWNTLSA